MASLIPFTNQPDQTLTVSLPVDGRTVTLGLRVRFSEVAGYWVLTISDRSANVLVDSIPLVCSCYPAANLLQQQAYLRIGSAYVINASGVNQDYPDSTNLGSDFLILWDDSPAF